MVNCTVEGRMLSLDVVNLFTCIPVPKAIEFLRNSSNGWGPTPPPSAKPTNPPTYEFPIDSKLFCDLIELCLSFNQFEVNGTFLRQVSGLFMGRSISPPVAMAYGTLSNSSTKKIFQIVSRQQYGRGTLMIVSWCIEAVMRSLMFFSICLTDWMTA